VQIEHLQPEIRNKKALMPGEASNQGMGQILAPNPSTPSGRIKCAHKGCLEVCLGGLLY
jgi:hypothetical protein